jgi:hypothetical protein
MPCGRLPYFLLGTGGDFLMPNVRAKRATTAGRQARAGALPFALRLSEGLGVNSRLAGRGSERGDSDPEVTCPLTQ